MSSHSDKASIQASGFPAKNLGSVRDALLPLQFSDAHGGRALPA